MHIHARHAVDPELNLIAKRLGSLTWHTDLDEDEKQGCADTQRNPDAPKRLVSPMPDYQTWAVRMYIGGAQRTLGLLKAIDLSPAFRFADMVKMHFWKYKLRGAHEPGSTELNISPERAKADLLFEPEVVQLIADIEHHLLGIGALTTAADVEQRKHQERERRSRQRTVSGTLIGLSDTWRTVLRENAEAQSVILLRLEKEINRQAVEIARVNTLLSELLLAVRLVVRPVTYGLRQESALIVQPREIPTESPPAAVPGFVTFIGDPAAPQ